ncbi:hypothetical protein N136_03997 [Leifsonia aquatica ATCC 14665]|uniref:Uncharacterized protein n=1 Tax=Leifsonia aquatica ATCC 14665 TaxID=1358026 RepID=U2RLD0_LEIAQ|nr:hypothetical protein N136_03997 [Leifsonia aquatica ATCC 14665]
MKQTRREADTGTPSSWSARTGSALKRFKTSVRATGAQDDPPRFTLWRSCAAQ